MANAYLNENAFRLILGHFDIDRKTVATQTAHIALEQMAHDGSCWTATNPESGLDNLTIFISDYFIRRIERILHYIIFYTLNVRIFTMKCFLLLTLVWLY